MWRISLADGTPAGAGAKVVAAAASRGDARHTGVAAGIEDGPIVRWDHGGQDPVRPQGDEKKDLVSTISLPF